MDSTFKWYLVIVGLRAAGLLPGGPGLEELHAGDGHLNNVVPGGLRVDCGHVASVQSVLAFLLFFV